jgi:hypothetical protein
VTEGSFESISSMSYTYISLLVDLVGKMTSGQSKLSSTGREAAPNTKGKGKIKAATIFS